MRFLPLLLTVFTLCTVGILPDASAVPSAFEHAGPVASSDSPPPFGELALFNTIFSDTDGVATAVDYGTSKIAAEPVIDEPSLALLFLAGLVVFCAARWGEHIVGRFQNSP